MIELRWVERDATNLHPATNVYPSRPRETVLQYRVLFEVAPATTETTVVPFSGARKEWTPWMDVPTVVQPAQPVSNIAYVHMPKFFP